MTQCHIQFIIVGIKLKPAIHNFKLCQPEYDFDSVLNLELRIFIEIIA